MSRVIFPHMDLTGVKGVLIDIDNTLYSYEPAHQKAIKACYEAYADSFNNDLSIEEFYSKYREKRDEVTERLRPQGACRSRFFAFQALFEEMGISQSFNLALEYETLYWSSLIDSMKLSEDADRFLNACHEKGIPVCAISDMQAHFQVEKLQSLGVDHLINYLVTSEEVGVEKPAEIIFETSLKKLNLTADEVIMVGDNENKDIKGAAVVGIKAYKVRAESD